MEVKETNEKDGNFIKKRRARRLTEVILLKRKPKIYWNADLTRSSLLFWRCFSSMSRQVREFTINIGLIGIPLMPRPMTRLICWKLASPLQTHSQGLFINAQMYMRRLHRLNKEFYQKAVDVKAKIKRLRAEAFAIDEVIETFKVKHIKPSQGLCSLQQKMRNEGDLCLQR